MPQRTVKTVHRLPITIARINLGQVVKRAHLNKECFVLEKDGIPIAGIVDLDSLEDILELDQPKVRRQIAASSLEHRKGRVRPASEFLAELRPSRTVTTKRA